MSKNINFNHILIFIIIITVSVYLGKLLYGNLVNKINYKTTYFDEDTDDSDTESDYGEQMEITDLINPIPNSILSGPINEKADLTRKTITDDTSTSYEGTESILE